VRAASVTASLQGRLSLDTHKYLLRLMPKENRFGTAQRQQSAQRNQGIAAALNFFEFITV
jgi:hypothetical protein